MHARAPVAADAEVLQRLRAVAAGLDLRAHGLDLAAYADCGRDPAEPLVGLGPAGAPVCFFGRDPGREELRLGEPFVGAAGKLLRQGLQRAAGVAESGDLAELLRAGAPFFWLNIVPYKPLGNDVWPARVRNAFRPAVLHALLARWQGEAVVALGQHAFEWFAVGQPAPVRAALQARWQQVLDPQARPVEVPLEAEGRSRVLRVQPLPHPSPRNVKGRQAFPALLDAALARLRAG
jgi:uracil-DNA glycosylase family 4